MAAKENKLGQVNASTRRIFLREGEAHPVFANNIEFSGMGADVFMDVGIVSPESVQAAMQASDQDSKELPVIDFHVVHRVAMSIPIAAQMHQKLGELLRTTTAAMEDVIKKGVPEPKG